MLDSRILGQGPTEPSLQSEDGVVRRSRLRLFGGGFEVDSHPLVPKRRIDDKWQMAAAVAAQTNGDTKGLVVVYALRCSHDADGAWQFYAILPWG